MSSGSRLRYPKIRKNSMTTINNHARMFAGCYSLGDSIPDNASGSGVKPDPWENVLLGSSETRLSCPSMLEIYVKMSTQRFGVPLIVVMQ